MNGRRGAPFHDSTRPVEDSAWLEQEHLEELDAAGRWADHLAEQSGVYPCDERRELDFYEHGESCPCERCW